MAGNNEIKEEYTSSLADLTFNSKPLISVLTILAEENIAHAKEIVEAIEAHLSRVCPKVKLPVLYLIDCIIKNVGENYTALFCQNIVSTFCSVFEQVGERTRAEMFKLRQTWNDVIPPKKLYALDVQIKQLDPAWPVTAPPPNSIHFNPKFLVTNTTASTNSTAPIVSKASSQLRASTNTSSLDPKTITMHQKLINKQRELLELQQRKLELELLQTQVKLHEQIKNQTTTAQSTTAVTQSQNLLLKPEVAKQLSISTKADDTATNVKSKTGSHAISTSAGNGRSHNNSTTRISPASGNLANARPVRDPRLLRHQQQQQQNQPNLSTTVNSVLVENKFKAGTQVTIDSENKIVNNKTNVRNERIEHGLVNNKGNIESHGKSKTLPHSSSPLKHTQKIGSSRKSSKSIRDSKLSNNLSSSSDSPTKKSDTKSRSTKISNLKFKKKSSNSNSVRSDKDGLSRSKETTSHSDKSSSNSGRYDKSDNLIHGVEKKSDKHSKSLKSVKDNKLHKSDSSAFFKDLKGSTKNRNYIRRNQICVSPELSQDVDLRLGGPPEKQARLQGDITDDKNNDNPNQPMDVDLRQLPAVVGKKRPSIENNDSPGAKKSKTEIFDVLFGREDTDLRQLPTVLSSPQSTERPPTPPPPIISDKNSKSREIDVEEKTQGEKPEISNFDALRAKLANAVNQDKFTSSQETVDDNKLKSPSDMDMRKHSTFGDRVGSAVKKIIISQADEEIIKTGNMTKAQGKALMTKIVAQIETQKLREAQRKESESISLQPISDDELEPDFSSESEDDNPTKDKTHKDKPKKSRLQRINLINDNREAIIPPQVSQLEDSYPKFARNMDYRDPRRGRNWRGTGRNSRPKIWENSAAGPPPLLRPGIHPPLRPPIEPWARQPTNSAWRSMAPSFPDNANIDETMPPLIPPHIMDQGSQSPNSNIQDIPALEYVPPNSYKFITIDREPREIRYYDETAIVFMSANDPREITFHNGVRRIYFDDEFFTLKLNQPYEEVSIKGNTHRVRLGGPSREIFIDGKGYECYFDQNEKTIDLDGNKIVVKLEPPPPQVKIGQEKRTDLVAGKIQLVVDAKNMFTVFLDAKPQTFEIDSHSFTLKFVDALRAVLIDDVRYEFEYGGLPKPIMLKDTKHFMRFSVLPRGIKPGHVHIKDMDNFKPISSPRNDNENSQDEVMTRVNPLVEHSSLGVKNSPERNSNSPSQFQNFLHNQNINNLDMLSSVMASSLFHGSSEGGYKVENSSGTDSQPEVQVSTMVNVPTTVVPQETVTAPNFNINDLFQKLVATGIVTSATAAHQPEEPPAPPPLMKTHFKNFKPVSFDKPETLKTRHAPRILSLYVGMQCSSCGMRFPPEHTMYYSQHLDWHFRQNRKGKKNIRKAASRRWYYILADWKNYEEIEDLEEREKSYFENQNQTQAENASEEAEEDIEIPCVSADPEVQIATCEVCQDRFEQFYNEEKDEWQLRKAIRVDEKIYHPLCYEDYQNSLLNESKLSSAELENESSGTGGGIPGLENVVEEPTVEDKNEEDDVMEIIDNIDDEDDSMVDQIAEDVPKSEVVKDEDDGDDDDVIINEVVPEKIIVDDDDKDDFVLNEQGLIPGVVVKIEPIDDGFVDVEDGVVKVLKENETKVKGEDNAVDDGEMMETETLEVEKLQESTDTTHIEVVSSIDGNVEFDSNTQPPSSTNLSAKIKINITKPLPAIINKDNHDVLNEELKVDYIDPSQPLPPGEEPVQLNVKPALKGLELRRQAMVKKGSELTGLCSIM